jgi:hypothetical protein
LHEECSIMKLFACIRHRARDEGMTLIEIMIIVVLISTIATAYWNYHITQKSEQIGEAEFSGPDSAITLALDEIGYYLHLARPDTIGGRKPFTVAHQAGSDKITILHDSLFYEYYIDNRGNLIRHVNSSFERLAEDIISLRALRMGAQTLVITLSTRNRLDSVSSGEQFRSYSKVVNSTGLVIRNAGL